MFAKHVEKLKKISNKFFIVFTILQKVLIDKFILSQLAPTNINLAIALTQSVLKIYRITRPLTDKYEPDSIDTY